MPTIVTTEQELREAGERGDAEIEIQGEGPLRLTTGVYRFGSGTHIVSQRQIHADSAATIIFERCNIKADHGEAVISGDEGAQCSINNCAIVRKVRD